MLWIHFQLIGIKVPVIDLNISVGVNKKLLKADARFSLVLPRACVAVNGVVSVDLGTYHR